jgi:hypothetical protein
MEWAILNPGDRRLSLAIREQQSGPRSVRTVMDDPAFFQPFFSRCPAKTLSGS